MIGVLICLPILALPSYAMFHALCPSHWIIRYIHSAFKLTWLSLYFLFFPSERCFQPTPQRVYQNPHSGMTATQRALSMPELVSEILQRDAAGYKEDHWAFDQTFSKTRFARYACVNSLWFHEAMRYLWWTPLPYSKLQALEGLPRYHRQVYANFFVNLSFGNDPSPAGSRKENRILKGLSLSHLRFAKMDIRPGQRLLSLPYIEGPALQELTIDILPVDDGKGGALSDEQMRKRLAKRLKVGFPGWASVSIHCTDIAQLSL